MKCTRRIEFDAAHRVVGHQNKCRFLHGHRYVLEVTLQENKLNSLGMVMDFGEMKNIIQSWINNYFDHNIILQHTDHALGEYIAQYTGQKIYYMQENPTAENIALHLKNDILPHLFSGNSCQISKVKLFETPNCFVEIDG